MSNNGNYDDTNNINNEEPKRFGIDSDDNERLATTESISDFDELQKQNRIENEQDATVKDLQGSIDSQLTKAEPGLTSVSETLQAMNNRLDEILSLLKNKRGKGKPKSKTKKKVKTKKGSQKKSKTSKGR